jgi:hypothetical protein
VHGGARHREHRHRRRAGWLRYPVSGIVNERDARCDAGRHPGASLVVQRSKGNHRPHRERRKPYAAVVLKGAPAKREGAAGASTSKALRAPVWFGQIAHRITYSLAACEFDRRAGAGALGVRE